jgi:hypothetical protein
VARGNDVSPTSKSESANREQRGQLPPPLRHPCVHEHACTRCRFLRIDPAQLHRVRDMTRNTEDRLAEAKERAWLSEVAALEESLRHLRQRRAEAERATQQPAEATVMS